MSKGKKIALWTISILLAALFLFAGGAKLLLQPEDTKVMFVHYGYAAWFATFIGVCETLGGIGLLLPPLAGLAAAGLSIIMVGAVYTHLSHHELSHAIVPLVLLVLLIGVASARFKQRTIKP